MGAKSVKLKCSMISENMYILDTDHLGILQRQRGMDYDRVRRKIAQIGESDIYVTIISFHEQVSGWAKYVKNSTDPPRIVSGYLRLEWILRDFASAQVLPFSTAASEVFEKVKRQRIRIATMDLRIASIAIVQHMTLVTCNVIDFERIPNLLLEDWTT